MARKIKTPEYTAHERLERVWDIENVKDLMSRRTVYECNGWHQKELDELWVSLPENKKSASFGRNWGYYVGMEEISRYYVAQYNERRMTSLKKIAKDNLQVEVSDANLGFGSMELHPLSTPHITLAYDGKSAQGTWYSIGHECVGKPDGNAECNWVCQKICADLVKEDDATAGEARWKIWHLFISVDFSVETGKSVGELQSIYIRGTGFDEINFGEPTISMLAHDPSYTWCDNYPPLNEEYDTFDEDKGYGPLGHPNYEEAER